MDDLVERARAFVDRHPSSVAPSLPAVVRGLLDRIAVLEGALERVVSGGLPEQLLLDADELEACGAGNEAKRMREIVARLKEFRRASLIREQGDDIRSLSRHS